MIYLVFGTSFTDHSFQCCAAYVFLHVRGLPCMFFLFTGNFMNNDYKSDPSNAGSERYSPQGNNLVTSPQDRSTSRDRGRGMPPRGRGFSNERGRGSFRARARYDYNTPRGRGRVASAPWNSRGRPYNNYNKCTFVLYALPIVLLVYSERYIWHGESGR